MSGSMKPFLELFPDSLGIRSPWSSILEPLSGSLSISSAKWSSSYGCLQAHSLVRPLREVHRPVVQVSQHHLEDKVAVAIAVQVAQLLSLNLRAVGRHYSVLTVAV
jgi:hypothetical protein